MIVQSRCVREGFVQVKQMNISERMDRRGGGCGHYKVRH